VERLEEIIKKDKGWSMNFSPTRYDFDHEDSWVLEFLNAVLEEYKKHVEAN
jgi:hypothetical protein